MGTPFRVRRQAPTSPAGSPPWPEAATEAARRTLGARTRANRPITVHHRTPGAAPAVAPSGAAPPGRWTSPASTHPTHYLSMHCETHPSRLIRPEICPFWHRNSSSPPGSRPLHCRTRAGARRAPGFGSAATGGSVVLAGQRGHTCSYPGRPRGRSSKAPHRDVGRHAPPRPCSPVCGSSGSCSLSGCKPTPRTASGEETSRASALTWFGRGRSARR
jgi:hypothetical protein